MNDGPLYAVLKHYTEVKAGVPAIGTLVQEQLQMKCPECLKFTWDVFSQLSAPVCKHGKAAFGIFINHHLL